MDEPWRCSGKWNKRVTEGQVWCHSNVTRRVVTHRDRQWNGDQWREEWRVSVLMGTVSVWEGEKILDMGSCDGYRKWICLIPLCFKNGLSGKFYYMYFPIVYKSWQLNWPDYLITQLWLLVLCVNWARGARWKIISGCVWEGVSGWDLVLELVDSGK